MMKRPTFLAWFVAVLALAGGAAFGTYAGAASAIWRNDASCMTSAIAALVLFSIARLGRDAWMADEGHRVHDVFAHRAEIWCVMLGMLGTSIGLSLQAAALASGGAASFMALSTSLYTTGSGIAGALIVSALTFNVERVRT